MTPVSLPTVTALIEFDTRHAVTAISQTSFTEFTAERRNFFLKRPKYRSRANLVCPTGKNEN